MQIKRFINIHTILLLVFLLAIGGAVYRINNWGEKVDPDQIESEGDTVDVMDLILPVMDEKGNVLETPSEISTIVCFGNAPFADDRDSEDNLANMIAERTGATVYNCSIGKSYLMAYHSTLNPSIAPLDSYNFYWLTQLAVKAPDLTDKCAETDALLGEDADPAAQGVCDTLLALDFSTVDVVVIMYDAADYLAGNGIYNIGNDTDIEYFTGNLEAGIELLQNNYPTIRIIVMSPTYAFGVDENGNYVSSDIQTYGQDVLSTYSIKECDSCFHRSVTFIDHLYGTINEDNAADYLIDNRRLNVAGRELVADRFVDALYYFQR